MIAMIVILMLWNNDGRVDSEVISSIPLYLIITSLINNISKSPQRVRKKRQAKRAVRAMLVRWGWDSASLESIVLNISMSLFATSSVLSVIPLPLFIAPSGGGAGCHVIALLCLPTSEQPPIDAHPTNPSPYHPAHEIGGNIALPAVYYRLVRWGCPAGGVVAPWVFATPMMYVRMIQSCRLLMLYSLLWFSSPLLFFSPPISCLMQSYAHASFVFFPVSLLSVFALHGRPKFAVFAGRIRWGSAI